MRVPRRKVQFELFIIIHDFVANLDSLSRSLVHSVLSYKWKQHWVNRVNFKDQQRLAKTNSKLNLGLEARVLRCHYLKRA